MVMSVDIRVQDRDLLVEIEDNEVNRQLLISNGLDLFIHPNADTILRHIVAGWIAAGRFGSGAPRPTPSDLARSMLERGTRTARASCEEVCSICLGGDHQERTCLPCDHIFHTACVEEWFQNYLKI